MASSFGKSINYISESPNIGTKLKFIWSNSKDNKRNFFNGYKRVAGYLVEDKMVIKFQEGCIPIQYVQLNACTIDVIDVVIALQNDSSETNKEESISTTIKCNISSLIDTIETDLTVSSVFGPFYHITDNGDIVYIFDNNLASVNLVVSLESEYYSISYSCQNCYCDENII